MKRSALKRKSAYKPVDVQRFHDWVARQGCLVCKREATIHHVTGYADRMGRVSRRDDRVVPLCPIHHQHDYGPYSVERIGHQAFYRIHGIDLMAEAERLAEARYG